MPYFLEHKALNTLTAREIDQIQEIVNGTLHRYNKDYIERAVVKGAPLDMVLVKDARDTYGCLGMKMVRDQTPFRKGHLPIVFFSLGYKRKEYRGNIIWRLGSWYARRTLGPLWPFRTFVSLTYTSTPKVYEQFARLCHQVYPLPQQEGNPAVVEFVKDYLFKHRQEVVKASSTHVFDYPEHPERANITPLYDKLYKAKDPSINDFFFEQGLLEQVGSQYFLTGKFMVVCGLRAPLKKLLRQKENPPTNYKGPPVKQ